MLPDAVAFVKLMKRAAMEAWEAAKPVQVCYGAVTSISPLQILVEQKLPLEQEDLVLSDHVMDTMAEVDGRMAIIKNGLAVGDGVILIREQGGQKYVVMGKTG